MTDIAVIGGGIAGASVAYHCGRASDHRVVVYERGDPAGETTAKSAAFFGFYGSDVERVTATSFTKEDLTAICEAVGYEIEVAGRLPPKAEMRAGILWKVGRLDEPEPDEADRPFRTAELEAIADALRDDG